LRKIGKAEHDMGRQKADPIRKTKRLVPKRLLPTNTSAPSTLSIFDELQSLIPIDLRPNPRSSTNDHLHESVMAAAEGDESFEVSRIMDRRKIENKTLYRIDGRIKAKPGSWKK
jgi:hypothetical protein